MNAPLSIRCTCMDTDGTIYTVTIRLAKEMRSSRANLIKSNFAGKSIRFTEFVVRFDDRKPIEIFQESHYLIRFDADGWPDMEGCMREVHARMSGSYLIARSTISLIWLRRLILHWADPFGRDNPLSAEKNLALRFG